MALHKHCFFFLFKILMLLEQEKKILATVWCLTKKPPTQWWAFTVSYNMYTKPESLIKQFIHSFLLGNQLSNLNTHWKNARNLYKDSVFSWFTSNRNIFSVCFCCCIESCSKTVTFQTVKAPNIASAQDWKARKGRQKTLCRRFFTLFGLFLFYAWAFTWWILLLRIVRFQQGWINLCFQELKGLGKLIAVSRWQKRKDIVW